MPAKGHNYPVYPQPIPERSGNDQRPANQRGLTLLDYFAAAALPVAEVILTEVRATYRDRPPVTRHPTPGEVAQKAYDLAEALLVERQQRLKSDSLPTAPTPTA